MKGMVAAPQPVAAEEGMLLLRGGGNAVDAAVTAAFVQAVADPLNCGLGGLGWMHLYLADSGQDLLLDFCATAGSRARADMWVDHILGPSPDGIGFILKEDVNEVGYQSIAVPGLVRGLHEALTRYGTISWDAALQPAIELARNGYAVPSELAQEWRYTYAAGRPDATARFTRTLASASIYTRADGRLPDEGDILVNEDLAGSMERIARDGPETFYKGEIAEQIARDLEGNGALVTDEDLAAFQVSAPDPLRATYRGYTISDQGPPSGGITLIEVLNILEGYDLAGMELNSTEYVRVLSQAMKAGFADRNRYVGDPAFVDVPVGLLTSRDHAEKWRERIDRGEQFDVGFDRTRHGSGTTHLSIVDDAGNCVSLTHTLGLCSGVVTPGLGFLYNNYMLAFDPVPGGPNSIAPGKKRNHGVMSHDRVQGRRAVPGRRRPRRHTHNRSGAAGHPERHRPRYDRAGGGVGAPHRLPGRHRPRRGQDTPVGMPRAGGTGPEGGSRPGVVPAVPDPVGPRSRRDGRP